MSKKFVIWLWLSVVLAVAGALMLFPIGSAAKNAVFVLIKIGMVSGLLVQLFAKKRGGLWLWTVCSGAAVVMTLIKWSAVGASFLLGGSIFVDIFMPAMAWGMVKKGEA